MSDQYAPSQFLNNDWMQYTPQAQPQGFNVNGATAPVQMGMGPQSLWGQQPLIDTSGLNVDVNAALNPAAVAQPGGGFWGGMLGRTEADGTKIQGWGGLALGAASGLANTYMGLQQYKLAKDSMKQSKREFDLNFGVQRGLTNTNMRDRQATRVAASPSAQSVDSYMAQNGVK